MAPAAWFKGYLYYYTSGTVVPHHPQKQCSQTVEEQSSWELEDEKAHVDGEESKVETKKCQQSASSKLAYILNYYWVH